MRHYITLYSVACWRARVQLTNIIVLINGFPLINQFSAEACLSSKSGYHGTIAGQHTSECLLGKVQQHKQTLVVFIPPTFH